MDKTLQGLEPCEIGSRIGHRVFLNVFFKCAANQLRNAHAYAACARLQAVVQFVLQVNLGTVQG